VRLLLDTHTLLWYVLGDPQLSATAQALIIDPANEILISPAWYWEIAIKVSLGKLKLHQAYENLIDVCLNSYGFAILPIEPAHTACVAALPFPPGHKDPFDRLLVALATVEGIAIVSADAPLDAYGIQRLW
jgi:PIN domain nuclease of toxin-antitoxin system